MVIKIIILMNVLYILLLLTVLMQKLQLSMSHGFNMLFFQKIS